MLSFFNSTGPWPLDPSPLRTGKTLGLYPQLAPPARGSHLRVFAITLTFPGILLGL